MQVGVLRYSVCVGLPLETMGRHLVRNVGTVHQQLFRCQTELSREKAAIKHIMDKAAFESIVMGQAAIVYIMDKAAFGHFIMDKAAFECIVMGQAAARMQTVSVAGLRGCIVTCDAPMNCDAGTDVFPGAQVSSVHDDLFPGALCKLPGCRTPEAGLPRGWTACNHEWVVADVTSPSASHHLGS